MKHTECVSLRFNSDGHLFTMCTGQHSPVKKVFQKEKTAELLSAHILGPNSRNVLSTYLVHHKRLDLPLKDLHAGCGDH